MDARTQELSDAHDVLAEFYAERLAGALEQMPVEQAVLGLFARLVRESGLGVEVADIGCGTGRLAPFLTAHGLSPRGLDLSPEMITVARRDQPGFTFEQGDVRALPYADASLGGALGWYSLMYLTPDDRAVAFGELARVVKPGGHLAMAYKMGDDSQRRGGRTVNLGVEFDIWWHSADEVAGRLDAAGFEVEFAGRVPQSEEWPQPQGYAVARRR
ncbi:class I SAM-dependent methyltransferase [Luteipulveratus halotolerans]|uniref:Methyltransferase type 11 n=1 Tax=Luteipulveratus halotolerans TaxID=1631356 RepID=A0A0L6CMA2_9MICO|nr:class I SAM-dependent methyltransferase [Luteipulveratus halotolerans]KNX38658.1 methyltransferase type 11 [Luteipulveratus halotolerans]